MAVFKCKMCGGALEVSEGISVCQCAYCDTVQTLPRLTDERRANLYDRANHYRRGNEFDKAAGVYEQILMEDNTDAEVYWSLVLCKYGVEYVEAPGSHKRVPTVHRVQYTSIFDDSDYQSALHYADSAQRQVYAAEAKEINEIQKGILAISQQEEPYYVFICYKERDDQGNRTPDSVLAQELYYELTELGYKVFFARITLENKLGTAYEPYIFAALNSSKVMVVVGTKKEYVNAVWVKNEWSRYLALIKGGAKKILVPAYKDMDAYDLPEEFSHLQAQDMSKLGFMQDLVRGIGKIVGSKKEEAPVPVAAAVPMAQPAEPQDSKAMVEPLLKRIEIFLEDGMFAEALAYCNKVLDLDPENGKAYLCLLMAQLNCNNFNRLSQMDMPFDQIPAYTHALRYSDADAVARLTACNRAVKERFEQEQMRRRQQVMEQQRLQMQMMERERQREEAKNTIRSRNKTVIVLLRFMYIAFVFFMSVLCGSMTGDVFVLFFGLMMLVSIPQTHAARQAFIYSVDYPDFFRSKRRSCMIWSFVEFTLAFIVFVSASDASFLVFGVTLLFWSAFVWLAKPLPKEYM